MASSAVNDDTLFDALTSELTAGGVTVEFVARGVSMSPSIRDGALVRLEPVSSDNLRIGDVVLFRTSLGDLLLHRLIRRRADGFFIFRGDACSRADQAVAASAVVGRVGCKRGKKKDARVNGRRFVFLAACYRALRRWRRRIRSGS